MGRNSLAGQQELGEVFRAGLCLGEGFWGLGGEAQAEAVAVQVFTHCVFVLVLSIPSTVTNHNHGSE